MYWNYSQKVMHVHCTLQQYTVRMNTQHGMERLQNASTENYQELKEWNTQ